MSAKTKSTLLSTNKLSNVHTLVKEPGSDTVTVKGDYIFYHYGIDFQDDRGWGCGYRTLQSLCSWVKNQLQLRSGDTPSGQQPCKPVDVPSIPHIQEALVAMGDKGENFKGSRDWIGSFEVCICVDYFYDVPCKMIHMGSGGELISNIENLKQHFTTVGSPIMMGGNKDSASKGIIGVCTNPAALLVMDPHYYNKTGQATEEDLVNQGYIQWKPVEEFDPDSFYNLCLPQLKAQEIT